MAPPPTAEIDRALKNGSPTVLLKEKQGRLRPPKPAAAERIVVPAAIIDTLVAIALSTDAGKGVMMGWRALVAAPKIPMSVEVQDGWLVPLPEGQR